VGGPRRAFRVESACRDLIPVGVLTADGKPVGPGEIRVLERQIGQAGEPDRIAAGFRPPALAPGSYQLLVTLTDPAGVAWTSTAELTIASGGGR
jgi:hypothetical protein